MAFRGGLKVESATPVSIGGDGFGAPGAPGFTAPGMPAMHTARNNRGTNVRIPYSRLVPLGPRGGESDGLESATLAWINGKHDRRGFGLNAGPERTQRLATTEWLEEHFKKKLAAKFVRLDALALTSDEHPAVAGATALHSVDVVHLYDRWFKTNAEPQLQYFKRADAVTMDGYLQRVNAAGDYPGDGLVYTVDLRGAAPGLDGYATGLFVLERGPFLRGKMVADGVADVLFSDGHRGQLPRNIGDRLAFDALYAKLAKEGLFDWTPDGMVLSKLQSPTGDALASAELDHQQAQLFNIAVQGPALATTWTGNPRLHCMPMDKVFVVVVADVVSALDAVNADVKAKTATQKVWDNVQNRVGPATLQPHTQQAINEAERADTNDYLNNFLDAREHLRTGKLPINGAIKDAYNNAKTAKERAAEATAADAVLAAQAAVAASADRTAASLVSAAKNTDKNVAEGKATMEKQKATAAATKATNTADGPAKTTAKNEATAAAETAVQAAAAAATAVQAAADAATALEAAAARDNEAKAESIRAAQAAADADAADDAEKNDSGKYIAAKQVAGEAAARQKAQELADGAFSNFSVDAWEALADKVRRGERLVKASLMTNFRLLRVTSSYLAMYSKHTSHNNDSRCGLRIGLNNAGAEFAGAEFIIGGWCVGSVLDNAATRSTVGQQVRLAPASMALNINVNVEWWSSDKLYRHYMNADDTVESRNALTPSDAELKRRRAFVHGAAANLTEYSELKKQRQ